MDALIWGACSLRTVSKDELARSFLQRAEQILVQHPAPELSARVRVGWAELADDQDVELAQVRADYRLLVRAGQPWADAPALHG